MALVVVSFTLLGFASTTTQLRGRKLSINDSPYLSSSAANTWLASSTAVSSKLPACLQTCPCLEELDRQGASAGHEGAHARADYNYNTCEVQKAWAQSALRPACSAACPLADVRFLRMLNDLECGRPSSVQTQNNGLWRRSLTLSPHAHDPRH